MMIVGKVVSGSMKGGIFLSQKGYVKRIQEKLGFHPYPGTLNLKLEPKDPKAGIKTRGDLEGSDSIRIRGFEEEDRFFGGLRCYPCKININNKGNKNTAVDGVVVVPDKTSHPPDIIEVISPVNIRNSLSLKDGDVVIVELTWE